MYWLVFIWYVTGEEKYAQIINFVVPLRTLLLFIELKVSSATYKILFTVIYFVQYF